METPDQSDQLPEEGQDAALAQGHRAGVGG